MADINNFSQIEENFDTIKTLLNSIRAQGILNTSDVDKLLSGINSKLERLNTGEDIDLIKIFLSELKQNLDERHSVLISKFGAIESLFTNLLKNSADSLKSSEVKELFDIVATNLSVFSREVVSQKETLTDIILRLDSMRSDDSLKKDVVKNIAVLKNDLEHLNNGFDSIVLSLNENFKTLIKTLSNVDQSDAINKFGSEIADVVATSNSILSAIQLLDKKNLQIEDSIKVLATQDDLSSTKKWISDLAVQQNNLNNAIEALSDKFYKVDNLAEKIDASVNIVVGLKSLISDNSEESSKLILASLDKIENSIKDDITALNVEEFKELVKQALNSLMDGTLKQDVSIDNLKTEIDKLESSINILASSINVQEIVSLIKNLKDFVTEQFGLNTDKVIKKIDINADKTIAEIVSKTQNLEDKFKEISSEVSNLCVTNFVEISDSVKALKSILSQLDENYVSGNNAIFSNITDRLAVFENSLKLSLDKQEDFVSNSATKLVEQLNEVKNLSGVLDYKLDASVIELNNAKREFSELKTSVNEVLGLDFVTAVKDLRVDLYASKQDLTNVVENSASEISEKLTNDLFSKYELLVSKLDSMEDAFKSLQKISLNDIKQLLDGLSSSLLDILSYVSNQKDFDIVSIDKKLESVTESIKDNNLNYIEDVRSIVEVIKTQVEANLIQIQQDTVNKVNELNSTIYKSEGSIKEEIKYSYNKLLEIQDKFTDIENSISLNNEKLTTDISDILNFSSEFRKDFEQKLLNLKSIFVDKVEEFKNEISCENTDNLSEVKFVSENLFTKTIQANEALNNGLKGEIIQLIGSLKLNIEELAEQIIATTLKIETGNKEVSNNIKLNLSSSLKSFVELLTEKLDSLDSGVKNKTIEVENSVHILENSMNSSLSSLEGMLSDLKTAVTSSVGNYTNDLQKDSREVKDLVVGLNENIQNVHSDIDALNEKTTKSLSSVLAQILDNFVALKTIITTISENSANNMNVLFEDVKKEFEDIGNLINNVDSNIDEDITRQISIIEDKFELLEKRICDSFVQTQDILSNTIKTGLVDVNNELKGILTQKLDEYVANFDKLFTNLLESNKNQVEFVNSSVKSLNTVLGEAIQKQNKDIDIRLSSVVDTFRSMLDDNLKVSSDEYENLRSKLADLFIGIEQSNKNMMSDLKAQFDDIVKFIDSGLEIQSQEVENRVSDVFTNINDLKDSILNLSGLAKEKYDILLNSVDLVRKDLVSELDTTRTYVTEQNSSMIHSLSNNLSEDLNSLCTKLTDFIKDQAVKIENSNIECVLNSNKDFVLAVKSLEEKFSSYSENIKNGIDVNSLDLKSDLDKTYNLLDDIRNSFEKDILNQSETIKINVNNLATTITNSWEEVEKSIDEKVNNLLVTYTDLSAGELQSLEAFVDKILQKLLDVKANSNDCANLVKDFVKQEINSVVSELEKESDLIISDVIAQFNLFKDIQKDELSKMTLHLESTIEDYVYNHINDLKSYLDVKTDNTVINHKLDSLISDIDSSVDSVLNNLNKLLETNVFETTISDLKKTNEVLVSTMSDNLNEKIEKFITDNIKKDIEEKFTIFDKKFIDTIVENYEEIKLVSTNYNSSLESLKEFLTNFVDKFNQTKNDLNNNISDVLNGINISIGELNKSFIDLKAQILNKSFDEAFQASMNTQIRGIEDLISRQFGYLEDISTLCCDNLPELTEMNAIVKHGIVVSIDALRNQLDDSSKNIDKLLKDFKTDVITQFINIFNQISFVAEQEEIVDFIQEKHSELITVLSHIVTNFDGIDGVKDSVTVIDTKIENIKDDIKSINEKISSIMSSEEDVDYVYSLQDLESDIANLRLILEDVKKSNKSEELQELQKSTEDIYNLVESLKDSFPKFEYDEFKQDFEALTEDIVSISTRTNKLILASDESYKTLQDNLQDFKLVINDLDERTRNFAQEAGFDKIDNKLYSINQMIQNGAKTNQVFNQVFEYLAEWVDKAGEKINKISDKVETLDEIGQIKVMLEDLKVSSEDNSESIELIEALGNIFDKQVKKISSLEMKLDRMIVETTINNKNNKIDMLPMETTLNKFLVAMDDKFSSQQEKINVLESKLEEVLSIVDSKDTTQLTKKVGGMDRQIAKLNKSIEKIASHVVEK